MAYSLGQTLYTLANRREAAPALQRPARPGGQLVWLHVPGPDAASPVLELARKLVEEDGLSALITCTDALLLPDGVLQDQPPPDTVADARAFLAHWRPGLAVFADGELRPALLNDLDAQGIPVVMVQARLPYLLRGREGWYPGLARTLLQRIPHILALDEPAARSFRKAGAAPKAVTVTGRLEDQSAVLPHTEAERVSVAEVLSTRPVWLVAGVDEAEQDAIITAHRTSLRLAHRLLLIVVPQDADQAQALAQKMERDEGWNVAQRAADQEPEPEVEVLIADSPAELGLWYRLAPVTFLGGSLLGAGCLRNPLEAAALGSALIAGPRPGPFGRALARLAEGRALRHIGSAGELADALSELLASDRAARLAHAAWSVTSDGAAATEQVLTLIRRLLDTPS